MAKKAKRRPGPSLSINDRIRQLVSSLKQTSWVERTVMILILLLLAEVLYFAFLVPGDSQLEITLAEKKESIEKEKISLSKATIEQKKNQENAPKNPTAVLEALDKLEAERNQYKYNPAGKKDPFLPFDFAPKEDTDTTKTPLERYDLGQLKLTAVLLGVGDAKAIVENAAGKGFTIKIGTKVGRSNGVVTAIDKEKIVIRERFVDFTGTEKINEIELRLRVKGLENTR
ncbi:MAG: pilus assembly protein PilP [bacterium]|nr:pilus assembly protein PilP [bacterium]